MPRVVEGGVGVGGRGRGCGLMRLFVDDFHLISRNCIKASLNTSLEGILMEKFKGCFDLCIFGTERRKKANKATRGLLKSGLDGGLFAHHFPQTNPSC